MIRPWLFLFACLGSQVHKAQWDHVGEGVSDGGIRTMFYDSLQDRVYCFGGFGFAGGLEANGAAYWDGDWVPLGAGVTANGFDIVSAIGLGGDSVIVSGFFQSAMGVPDTRNMALWDGNAWTSIGPNGSHGIAWRMLANEDGLTVAGGFDTIADVAMSRIGRYMDGQWQQLYSYPTGPQFISFSAIVKYDDHYLFGGNLNVPEVNELGWLDGDTLRQLGTGILGDSWVNDMVEFQGKVFIGGEFYAGAGNAGSGLMTWDGTSYADPVPGVQFTTQVVDLDVHGGELFISGHSMLPGSSDYYTLARYDGERICLFGKNLNTVFLCIAATEAELFAAPNMPTLGLGGDTVNYIVRYDLSFPADTCIELSTGVGELANVPFTIAPNPMHDVLTLRNTPATTAYVELRDALGRLVDHERGAVRELDVHALSAGTYVLSAYGKNGQRLAHARVVKQ